MLLLAALVTSAITVQENYYHQLGLRDRILNFPLMIAVVLTLLWPDVAEVTELTRMLVLIGPTTVLYPASSDIISQHQVMRWLVTRHPSYHLIHIQKRAFLDRLYELILIMLLNCRLD